MKMDDDSGREVLFTLATPLAFDAVAAIATGTGAELGALGYTEISLLSDGSNRVVARPPEPREGS